MRKNAGKYAWTNANVIGCWKEMARKGKELLERDGWWASERERRRSTEVADRSSFKLLLLLLLLAYINNCQKQIGKVMRLQLMRPAEIVAVKTTQQPNGSAQNTHTHTHTHSSMNIQSC